MAQRNDRRPKAEKSRGKALVKVDGLWVHRGSVQPDADWERVIENIRDERIASVLKA